LLNELKKHPQKILCDTCCLKSSPINTVFTEPAKGVEAADAAIVLARKLNSDVKLAGAYSNKATNLHKLGSDSEALALYRIAINIHLRRR